MNEQPTGEWQADSILPVSVVTGHLRQTEQHRGWSVQGIVVGERFASDEVRRLRIRSGPEGDLFMWTGFKLRLRTAQANDYALNINTEQPRVYVIADPNDTDGLRPFLTTVSLDEAQHLDSPELRDVTHHVYSVTMPPEVFRWMEHFVLDHYRPKRRKSRGKQRSRLLYDAEVGDWAGDA